MLFEDGTCKGNRYLHSNFSIMGCFTTHASGTLDPP